MVEFSDDENGDVLRRMVMQGDNLSIPRDIDFQVVFPNVKAAEGFADFIASWGYSTEVRFPGARLDMPWDVNVVRHMTLSHADISNFEIDLARAATKFGGHIDGWGCFRTKSS